MTDGLDRLRADVVQACRELAASGLVIGSAGNVSARSGDLVLVTPTGAPLAALTADDLAVVDLDGALIDAPLAPTSELPLHLASIGASAPVPSCTRTRRWRPRSPASPASCRASTTRC